MRFLLPLELESVNENGLSILWSVLDRAFETRFASQSRAVLEGKNGHPLLPEVDASPESFFMKIQAVRPVFFRNVFAAFTAAIYPKLPCRYAEDLGIKTFSEIYAADGSRLEKVGRLLKVTRTTTRAILPGSMEALYDVNEEC